MTRFDNTYYHIYGSIEKETEKAFLFKLAGTTRGHWIPKSQIRSILLNDPNNDNLTRLECNEWILDNKGIAARDRFDIEHPGYTHATKPRNTGMNWEDMDDDIPF